MRKLKQYYAKLLAKQKPIADTGSWKERDYQLYLASIIGGNTEVLTPIGRIDIINNHIVCEVKFASTHGNKAALGQALCYTYYHPGYVPAIALIGQAENSVLNEVCNKYSLIYFYFWNGLWQINI